MKRKHTTEADNRDWEERESKRKIKEESEIISTHTCLSELTTETSIAWFWHFQFSSTVKGKHTMLRYVLLIILFNQQYQQQHQKQQQQYQHQHQNNESFTFFSLKHGMHVRTLRMYPLNIFKSLRELVCSYVMWFTYYLQIRWKLARWWRQQRWRRWQNRRRQWVKFSYLSMKLKTNFKLGNPSEMYFP